LDKSKEHRYLLSDIRQSIVERRMQLWVQRHPDVDGVVLTEIQRFPRATECVVFMVCGVLHDDWRNVLSNLIDGARKMGCTHASAYVRSGFLKRMPDWQQRQTYIVKDLK
jgi:hypothetical protein